MAIFILTKMLFKLQFMKATTLGERRISLQQVALFTSKMSLFIVYVYIIHPIQRMRIIHNIN